MGVRASFMTPWSPRTLEASIEGRINKPLNVSLASRV